MPRVMTMRGMRALDRTIALPRETQAAAKTAQAVGAQMDRLVPSISPAIRTQVLSEGFADAMQAMAIKRDPYVSMYSTVQYLLSDAGVTIPLTANMFNVQPAGIATSGVPGIWHNLLDDRQPLKPCLIHTLGVTVAVQSDEPFEEWTSLIGARITLQRNKEDLFEVPLSHCLMGAWNIDAAGTAAPIIDIEPLAGGGLEIEGHGAPFLMDEAIGLRLDYPGGGAFTDLAAGTGMVLVVARVDGEVMDV